VESGGGLFGRGGGKGVIPGTDQELENCPHTGKGNCLKSSSTGPINSPQLIMH